MGTAKKLQTCAVLASVAIVVAAGLAHRHMLAPRRAADPNPLVAVVNDTYIHQSDLSVLSPPATTQEALGLMVDFTLLDQEARRKNVTVSDAEMQQQRRHLMGGQSGMSYADMAHALNRTSAGLDLQLRHVVLLYKLAALRSNFPIGRMIHARGILIRPNGKRAGSEAQARAMAETLQKQVAWGADIAALARTDSDDSVSAPSGGDLGIIQLAGAPNLVRFAPDFKMQVALTHVVKTAVAGRVLPGPIHGDFGYWVVQIVSTSDRPGTDTAEYRQVRGMWGQQWIGRMEPMVMANLRGSAVIEPPIDTQPQQPRAMVPPAAGRRSSVPTM